MEKFWPWLAGAAIGTMLPAGLALTGAINFWVGVAFIVLACIIVAAYPWIGWKNRERKGRIRASIAATVVCAICLFLVFSPAPLSVLIIAVPGSYPEGEMVRGI